MAMSDQGGKKKQSFHITYSFLAANFIVSVWRGTPVFPTTHSGMTLKSEQWMAQGKREWEGEVRWVVMGRGMVMGDLSQSTGKEPISRR